MYYPHSRHSDQVIFVPEINDNCSQQTFESRLHLPNSITTQVVTLNLGFPANNGLTQYLYISPAIRSITHFYFYSTHYKHSSLILLSSINLLFIHLFKRRSVFYKYRSHISPATRSITHFYFYSTHCKHSSPILLSSINLLFIHLFEHRSVFYR